MPVGVVLAGGAGSRMGGRDKAFVGLAGRPLLDHVLGRIRPQVTVVAIAAGDDPGRFASWDLPALADDVGGRTGPLAGILAGMDWAAAAHPSARRLLSVPTDAPFLPPNLGERLAEVCDDTRIAVAASGGRIHFVTALWPVDLVADLRAALEQGVRKVEDFARRYPLAVAEFPVAPFDPFLNVNRPDDLTEAERLLSG